MIAQAAASPSDHLRGRALANPPLLRLLLSPVELRWLFQW